MELYYLRDLEKREKEGEVGFIRRFANSPTPSPQGLPDPIVFHHAALRLALRALRLYSYRKASIGFRREALRAG